MSKSEQAAEQSVSTIATEMEVTTEQLALLRAKEQQVRAEVAEVFARRNNLAERAHRELAALRSELLASYPLLRKNDVRLLLGPTHPTDALRTRGYLGYVEQHRLEQVRSSRRALQALARSEQELGRTIEALIAVSAELAAKQTVLRQDQRSAKETLAAIRRRKQEQARVAQALRTKGLIVSQVAQAMRILDARRDQRALVSLAQDSREAAGPSKVAVRPKSVQDRDRPSIEPAARRKAPPRTPAVKGKTRFTKLKGTLAWPVEGRVQRRVRDAPLRYRKGGVWLLGRPNAAVHAIAHGTVAFADEFRGLGKLLILDHGEGYLSLYAQTATLLKRQGDLVETGEVIGSLGPRAAGTPRLYFEIRHRGDAQDPVKWCSSHAQ
ncbi:MAG: peptidoglycan DD-metalloendopeptidase family protein [Gammaproteobacteria bacterium]|nr:peptidoglycan DD-metalloendopeptidase family protein [Gammaproteobacteria bacterium]